VHKKIVAMGEDLITLMKYGKFKKLYENIEKSKYLMKMLKENHFVKHTLI
jgi:hypothetical protein